MSVVALREVVDDNPENDIYTLEVDSVPPDEEHMCVSSGVDDLVKDFRAELESLARRDPTQPFPTMYKTFRLVRNNLG